MKQRVLLGIVSAGAPTKPFLDALAHLVLPPSVDELARSVATGNFIPAQRDLVMSEALERGFDYLFFVDDDIIVPAAALVQLLETATADPLTAVVGGLYYSRDSARPIAVADWHSSDTSQAHIPSFSASSTDVVDGIGFGCALLRVSVARDMQPPYFAAHIYVERSSRRVRQADEDYLWCERVRSAGFRVRLDARVRCGHYDRLTNTTAPRAWEADAVTARPRMIVSENGVTRMVPFEPGTATVSERHLRADVVYVSVDS